jgi:predicted permease
MAVAILAPGTSREAATAVLGAVSAGLRRDGALAAGSSLVFFEALQRRMGARYRLELSLLLGAVLLVLFVACVNVAHLLLARVSAREGELAVMGALGASRVQAFRVVLVESALVAAAGGLGGVLVARVLLVTMLASVPDQLKMVSAAVTGLDWRALAFAVSMSTLTCLAVALLPVLRASRVDVIDALKGRGPGVAGGRHDWWHGAMVVTQLGLVVMLMVTAGLLLRSFTRLVHVPPGFDPDGLVVTELQFARERYDRDDALRVMGELRARLAAVPGVSAVTLSDTVPPRGGSLAMNAKPQVEGQPPMLSVERLVLPVQAVAADYFATVRIPILAGRSCEPADGEETIVVNTVLARRLWGGRSPLGQRFRPDEGWPWATVVGVAGDVKQAGLDDPMGEGMEAYQPLTVMRRPWTLTMTVRSASDPAAVVRRIRDELKMLDPLLPVVEVSTMEQRLVESVVRPRFLLRLSGMFAIVAVLVAAIGVYGATAYWVARRQRELGLRLALGSTSSGVVRLVVGRGVRLAVWACVIGLGATLLLSRAVRSLLFETDPLEPAVLAGTALAVIGFVVIASLLPAIRAGRIDPMRVLKSE